MSIIGIVWFSLSFILIINFNNSRTYEAAVGWGVLGMLYAIAYSIVGLIQSYKKNHVAKSAIQQLIELAELKEKGILSEDEFQAKKVDLLKM